MHSHRQPNARPPRPVPAIRTIEILPHVVAQDVGQIRQTFAAASVDDRFLNGRLSWRRERERHLPRTRHGFIVQRNLSRRKN